MKRVLLMMLVCAGCTGGIVDLVRPSSAPSVVPGPDCVIHPADLRCPPPPPLENAARTPHPVTAESFTSPALYSMSGNATLATLPPFVVLRDKITCKNCVVRLTVKVPKAALSPGCQQYDSYTVDYPFAGTPPPPPPPPPPPLPGPCGSLSTTSAYIGFYGSLSGCTPSRPACRAGEAITFVSYPMNGWGFTCEPFAYVWEFGDGSPNSTAAQPTHTYTKNGRYTVRHQITDGSGRSAVFDLRGIDSRGAPVIIPLGVTGEITPGRRRAVVHP